MAEARKEFTAFDVEFGKKVEAADHTEWLRNYHARFDERLPPLEAPQAATRLTSLAYALLGEDDRSETETVKVTRESDGLTFYHHFEDPRKTGDFFKYRKHEYTSGTLFAARVAPDGKMQTATRFPTYELEVEIAQEEKAADDPKEAKRIRDRGRRLLENGPRGYYDALMKKRHRGENVMFGDDDFLIANIDLATLSFEDSQFDYDDARYIGLLIRNLQNELILKANQENTDLVEIRGGQRYLAHHPRRLHMDVQVPMFLETIRQYPDAMDAASIRLYLDIPRIGDEQRDEVFSNLVQMGLPPRGKLQKWLGEHLGIPNSQRLRVGKNFSLFEHGLGWNLQYNRPRI